MSVKIRLARTGRHSTATYRLVAADSRFARDGRYIELIGHYDPQFPADKAVIDEAVAMKWLQLGAQPSDTVRTLLQAKGILAKFVASKKPVIKKKTKKPFVRKAPATATKTKVEPAKAAPTAAKPAPAVKPVPTAVKPAAEVKTPADVKPTAPQNDAKKAK